MFVQFMKYLPRWALDDHDNFFDFVAAVCKHQKNYKYSCCFKALKLGYKMVNLSGYAVNIAVFQYLLKTAKILLYPPVNQEKYPRLTHLHNCLPL